MVIFLHPFLSSAAASLKVIIQLMYARNATCGRHITCNNNKINYIRTQSNMTTYFIALSAASFGRYRHHQASFVQKFKMKRKLYKISLMMAIMAATSSR
jgi:hypothetical protein